jgi:thymidylate synthase (FAD)
MTNQITATYIDSMGSDLSVVNAARVSFGKKSDWEFSALREGLLERDAKLINYLAKHKHISPFGHAFASFHVKAPIFVARQLVKHKFLRWNEISRRYVEDEPEFYVPEVWRGKAENIKQGSAGVVSTQSDPNFVNYTALRTYNEMLSEGVAPEMARMVLPTSQLTEWIWSGSLDAFADMCRLRCATDTQYETRLVADDISKKMSELFPVSWSALLNNS